MISLKGIDFVRGTPDRRFWTHCDYLATSLNDQLSFQREGYAKTAYGGLN